MRSPAPSVRNSARAKVVLPAPSSPRRYTTPPFRTAGASRCASAIVAASSGSSTVMVVSLSAIYTSVHQGAEIGKQVARKGAAFAGARGQPPCARVNADTYTGRVPRRQPLREQATDHAGERIAGAAAGESCAAPGTHRDFALRRGD